MKKNVITILMAALSISTLPSLAHAKPSDVDQYGNPVGLVEVQNAPVTEKSFAYAILDVAMNQELKLGADNKFYHHRLPMEIDKQPAVLMNRDTLYSFAIIDASHGANIHVPKGDGRYVSVHVMEHDHTTKNVFYGEGNYKVEPNSTTKFVVINIRTQVNPNDPADIEKANKIQDQYQITFPDGYKPETFKMTNWDMKELGALKAKYEKIADTRGLSKTMGARGAYPQEDVNVGAAVATGLLPDKDAWYSFDSYDVDKAQCYSATYDVPEMADPALGFYSMTIYGDDLYLHTEAGSSLSNHEIVPNKDGKTFTLHFGTKDTCGSDAQNLLIAPTDNWTLAFRVYFPGESVQNNEYKLATPQLAK
ncbi:DUF1254 domain-containing protein [Vibrio sp. CK2-1]|uniref:DUF1254 domain-containing protein n=1 Tax=Vibrio sp. CK2-1 TaxID=2912249 RepID=UPI001F4206C0|nr:DUF1254 domain-containing protein [Vibrio sp. CK2-1]MCF7354421.1 DUF1254 domain-containing protein [Vibrio sp. CK2-1]